MSEQVRTHKMARTRWEIYFGSGETETEFIHFALMILTEIAANLEILCNQRVV